MNNTGDYAIAFFTVVFTAEYSVKGRKAHKSVGCVLGSVPCLQVCFRVLSGFIAPDEKVWVRGCQ